MAKTSMDEGAIAQLRAARDWAFLSDTFPYIGIYYEVSKPEENVHMIYPDANAAKILRMDYDSLKDGISYEKFTNWLMEHTNTPVAAQRYVYEYHVGNEHYMIKINTHTYEGGSVSFIQNLTDFALEQASQSVYSNMDATTGLITRQAMIERIREYMAADTRGCLAVLHIRGIENLNHWYGYNYSDRGMIAATKTLLHFSNEQVLVGVKAAKEYLIYFRDKDSSEVYRILTELCKAVEDTIITDDFGEMITGGEHLLSASVGYCNYRKDTDDFDARELLNRASFALTEAMNDRDVQVKPYTEESYQKDKARYSDVLSFMRLMNDNLFQYFFQPIVDTKTGDIYAYEMLMRTKEGIDLGPERILTIASEKNQLYDIEKATIYNALDTIHRNISLFERRRLFVNSIPAHILKDEHFEEFRKSYPEVFDRVVIEFTEQTEVSDENLAIIQKRCRDTNMGLAIDDYGTGYSNVSSLLRYAPNYVKIDRSLLTQIHLDAKKQHLVSNIITFAHNNGILVLAEGVETSLELKSVIALGADLIQGFYTAKPAKTFLPEISEYVRKEINIFHQQFEASENSDIYSVTNESMIRLTDIDEKIYHEILIDNTEVTIDGSASGSKAIYLRTKPNCKSHVILENVNLKRCGSNPSIILGENSTLRLEVRGRNYMSGTCGIYVPSNSKLSLFGDGDLQISCDSVNSYGIGCDATHSYGNIVIDIAGQLSIHVNGDNTIGIGGGRNSNRSFINLQNSDINITTTGVVCLGVGCLYEGSNFKISNTDLAVNGHGTIVCALGSKQQSSTCYIDDSGLTFVCSGDTITGIGVEAGGYGDVNISHSNVMMTMNGDNCLCIGTRDGQFAVNVKRSKIRLNCEATEATGIGDREGRGDVSLRQTILNMNITSQNLYELGSPHGNLTTTEVTKG